jgi:hypothetical protein
LGPGNLSFHPRLQYIFLLELNATLSLETFLPQKGLAPPFFLFVSKLSSLLKNFRIYTEWVGVLEIAPNPYWVSTLIDTVIKKSNAQVITSVGWFLPFL